MSDASRVDPANVTPAEVLEALLAHIAEYSHRLWIECEGSSPNNERLKVEFVDNKPVSWICQGVHFERLDGKVVVKAG